MTTTFTRTVVSLGLLCGLAVGPAFAEPKTQSRTVRFADLDLTSDAGAQALRSRVAFAVTAVCGDADHRDLEGMSEVHACRVNARASAKPQVQLALGNAHSAKAYTANNAAAPAAAS